MKRWFEKYDVLAKVLAVLVALVLWVYVISVVKPDADVEFKNLKPTFSGSEELLNTQNLAVSNLDDINISVTLSGARKDLVAVTENDINIVADISKLKEPGEYNLTYTVNVSIEGVVVKRKTPNVIRIKLDRFSIVTVPVRVALLGEVESGYMADEIVTNPSKLTLIGMEDAVSKVAYAQVKVSKQSISATIEEDLAFELYDKDGNLVSRKGIQTDYNTIDVTVPVLKLVDLPLSIEFAEGGGALTKNANYKIEPESIKVAVDSSHAGEIKPFKVGVVDLSKLTDSSSISFQITLPDGYKNISGETTATADVEISGLSKKKLSITAIEITNIPAGYTIEPITQNLDVTLRGSEEAINQVLTENVRAVVDLTSTVLTPGQHMMPATIVVAGTKGVGAIGEYKIVVRVSKR